MNKFNLWIQKYLVWTFPNIVLVTIWNSYQTDQEIRATESIFLSVLWEIMSWGLMIWFLCLFIFMILLIFRIETQEQTIKSLAGIIERDEREEIVTAIAARRTFVSTTSFLIFLFFLSSVQLNLSKNPNTEIDGKKNELSLGFRYSFIDSPKAVAKSDTAIYEHRDIPLTKSAIVLLILIWQLVFFRIRVRKGLKYA